MKTFFIYLLRTISFILLPIGTFLTLSPHALDFLAIIPQSITPTSLTGKILVFVTLFILPIFIIFFLHPKKQGSGKGHSLASKTWFGIIQKPTHEALVTNLVFVAALIVLGAAPLIMWVLIYFIFLSPILHQMSQ